MRGWVTGDGGRGENSEEEERGKEEKLLGKGIGWKRRRGGG